MGLKDVLALLGGLALFLYGMQMMSAGLEAAAGSKMKGILERLTANRLLGVLVGALITAVIQSSSATTVMVVGFVNAGMMTLQQAIWLIMGANIGTTVTSLLIALDVGVFAPVLAFVGVLLMMFIKNLKTQHMGQILAGLGVLFIGMEMMSTAMYPLRESETFIRMMSTFSNPLLGISAGALFTALIQSSSASIGVLQTLAGNGVIGLGSSVYVLFGQNIGTCITALLASIGTNRSARRATLVHLFFNLFGTLVFTLVCLLTPLTEWVSGVLPGQPQGQIAMIHVLFNLSTTLLLLPVGGCLARLAVRLLPDRPEPADPNSMHLCYLTPICVTGKDGGLGGSAIAMDQLSHELRRMLSMAHQNVDDSFLAILNRDSERMETVHRREGYLDFLNHEISNFVSDFVSTEANEENGVIVSSWFLICGDIERIGDHANNLAGYTRVLLRENIRLSEEALEEISAMHRISLKTTSTLLHSRIGDPELLTAATDLEQQIDDMTRLFHCHQLERMKKGISGGEASLLFSELLTDFERIGDHALNIAQELDRIRSRENH